MKEKQNRQYKDTVFRDLFGTDQRAKERFISLYNALHDTNLDEDCEIQPLDIEQVMYMNFSNDLARLVDGKVIILAEHQSTINENMPLRCLQYIGRIYEQLQDPRDKYHRQLVKIPAAEFYVFYNGQAEYPESKILKLSDAFMVKSGETQLELSVKVLNINTHKAGELLKKCPALSQYSLFVDTVRRHLEKDSENGFTAAIKECLARDILSEYLHRKTREVVNMLLSEYDYATDIEVQREEAAMAALRQGMAQGLERGLEQGLERGLARGLEQGLERGAHQKALETAKALMHMGIDVVQIAQATGLSVKDIESL